MKSNRYLPALALVLSVVMLVAGVHLSSATSSPGSGPGGKLQILTTFPPMTCFALNVAGDAAVVEQLLPAGAEPHDFALSPGDLKKLAKADVVVENGLGLEAWLEGALQSGNALRVVASDGIASEEGNPHVWLDPILAIQEVENIRKALVDRDPAHAEAFNRNAAAFSERLRTLDAEIRSATDKMPDKRLLPFHDAFHYFAKRYGFEVVGVFEEFPGREPTPRYIAKLRKTVREKNVRVLFTEPQESPRILHSLSDDLKLPIVEIDPMEVGNPSPDLYEKAMRSNIKHLTEALGGH